MGNGHLNIYIVAIKEKVTNMDKIIVLFLLTSRYFGKKVLRKI